MSVSRRHKIEAMLLDEPDDIFLRYSLAIELCGENEWETGHAMLVQLTHMTPPYVPAFFMIANQAVPKGLLDTARSALRDGIEEARRQGNTHAAGEMAGLLATLGEFGET